MDEWVGRRGEGRRGGEPSGAVSCHVRHCGALMGTAARSLRGCTLPFPPSRRLDLIGVEVNYPTPTPPPPHVRAHSLAVLASHLQDHRVSREVNGALQAMTTNCWQRLFRTVAVADEVDIVKA